jgi:hypothetical protein
VGVDIRGRAPVVINASAFAKIKVECGGELNAVETQTGIRSAAI